MEKYDIHIVGMGNLGTAFLSGLERLDLNIELFLYDDSSDVREIIKNNYLKDTYDHIPSIEDGVLILCMKPQNIISFFDNNKENIGENVLVCSPVAGLEIGTIEQYLKNPILRIMPNLLIRDNSGFIPFSSNYEEDYLSFIKNILNKLGTVKEFDESMFPIITAISGSGPAWFYELSKQIVNSGFELGLSEEESEMIIKNLVNALPSLLNDDETFNDLINKVKSPGGTTEAGLNSLDNNSFDKVIFEAMQKATQRSIEISKELSNE